MADVGFIEFAIPNLKTAWAREQIFLTTLNDNGHSAYIAAQKTVSAVSRRKFISSFTCCRRDIEIKTNFKACASSALKLSWR